MNYMFNNPVVNEYLWSSLVTFVASFGVAVSPLLTGPSPITFTQAAVFGIVAVGVRAGFRAVLNLLTTKFNTVSSTPK